MADHNSGDPSFKEAVRMGVANACLQMPKSAEQRRDAVNRVIERETMQKEAIAEAKEEVDLAGAIKTLTEVHGVSKAAVEFVKKLNKMKAGDAAATLTQVALLARDYGYLDADLVSLAQQAEETAGQQSTEQGSVFDNTPAGSRPVDGERAEERAARESRELNERNAAAAAQAGTGPGLDLAEAQRRFEEENAKVAGRAGRKPKAWKDAKAQLDAAQAAATEQPAAEQDEVVQDGGDESTAEAAADPTEIPDLPEAEPGQVSAHMKEVAAAGEAHLQDQIAKRTPGAVPSLDDDEPADTAVSDEEQSAAEHQAETGTDPEPEPPTPAPPAPARRGPKLAVDNAKGAAPKPPAPRRAKPLEGATGQGSYAHNP